MRFLQKTGVIVVGWMLAIAIEGLAVSEIISYTYDSLNRVTQVQYGDRVVINYTYDAAGNRLTQTINQAPVFDPAGNKTVDEGGTVDFALVATDPDGNPLTYSATGLPPGASFDPVTRRFFWTPGFAQAGVYRVTFNVTDGVLTTSQFIDITVNDALPAVSINNVSVTEGNVGTTNAVFTATLAAASAQIVTVSYGTGNGTATAGIDYVAQSGMLTFNPGETTKNITILVNGDTAFEPNETFFVNLTSATNATIGIGQGVGTIVNDDFPLAVTAFHATPSGFDVDFNKPMNVSVLNLYDNQAQLFGPADVTIVGAATGPVPVRGSLVVDGPVGAITFVKTHSVLEPDTYTVTLRSADNGFKDTDGNLLDGDGDGTPGGDYVTSFSVTLTNSVIVSVPDFVVGPGQSVNVPFNRSGLPIILTGGADVTNIEFTLLYNPDLLTIDTVTSGEALPADATVQVNSTLPGALTLRVGSPTGLGASPIELARLTASVPDTAVYKSTQVLSFEIASLTPAAPGAMSADAVHVVAYIGDTTGNAAYNSLDAQRVLRVVVGLDSGFTAYPLVDPLLIGDASWNRVLNSLDATRILQEVVGLDRLEIPPIPQK